MLRFLPGPLLAFITVSLLVANTLLHSSVLIFFTLLKLLVPVNAFRRVVTVVLVKIAESWVTVNDNGVFALLPRITYDIELPDNLKSRGWYLVNSNHQSWVDIFVLFHVFNRRIPFLKFFLKQELIWVPVIGICWWALDYPFMKRHSKEFLDKHPEYKGKDLATTRHACEKFKALPVSVMNFLEGTRFTPAKQGRQKSPYQYLLKPKAGGIAFVLSAMGTQMHSMLDVTIAYPDGIPGFWSFLMGKVRTIRVHVMEREIPSAAFDGDYENDPAFRSQFQAWIGELWQDKDARLAKMLTSS